jgi:hypothetical protein
MKNPLNCLLEGPLVGSSPLVWCVAIYALAKQRVSPTRDCTVTLNPVLMGTVFACDPSDVSEAIEVLCEPCDDGIRLVAQGGFEYRMEGGESFSAELAAENRRAQNRAAQRKHRSKSPKSTETVAPV